MFHIYLVFALPQFWNQPLLQEALVPFIGENRSGHWYTHATQISLLLGCLKGQNQEIYVCILTHVYTHIYISMFISISIYLYMHIFLTLNS